MSYAVEHAGALADVTEAGAAVTFSKVSQGSYDPETDTATPSTSTVAGSAVRVPGDPERYSRLNLVESKAVTLLFAPTTFGDTPALGATCSWGGETLTVRDVEPLAPDGNTIIATVVVSE